jgi:hypothetical protein
VLGNGRRSVDLEVHGRENALCCWISASEDLEEPVVRTRNKNRRKGYGEQVACKAIARIEAQGKVEKKISVVNRGASQAYVELSPLRKIVALLADGAETVALKVRVPFGVPVCMGLARERLRVSAYARATSRKTASIDMENERANFFIFIFLRCFVWVRYQLTHFSGCELFVFRKRHAEAGAECSAAIGATITFDDQ